jgi:hypothetical protein
MTSTKLNKEMSLALKHSLKDLRGGYHFSQAYQRPFLTCPFHVHLTFTALLQNRSVGRCLLRELSDALRSGFTATPILYSDHSKLSILRPLDRIYVALFCNCNSLPKSETSGTEYVLVTIIELRIKGKVLAETSEVYSVVMSN